MAACVPIKEMKDTAAFTKRVEEARGPITVTRNGYDAFVVMRSSDYEALQDELAKARLMSRIAKAEWEYAAGAHSEGSSFVRGMRSKYGL